MASADSKTRIPSPIVRRLRPVSVKSMWRRNLRRLLRSRLFWFNVSLDFVLWVALPALRKMGFTKALTIELAESIPTAIFGWAVWYFVEYWEWLKCKLEPQGRCIGKAGFDRALFPEESKENEYFVLQVKIAGMKPLCYPKVRDGQEVCEVPAYEVWSFLEGPWTFENSPKPASRTLHFVKRFGAGDNYDRINQFSTTELRDYAQSSGKRLEDNPATWVTGLQKDDEKKTVVIGFENVTYFQCYVLCNEEWFQFRKFPIEEKYPFYLLQSALPDMKRGLYNVLEHNPAKLGLEVILKTADGKIVLQQRSGGTATNVGDIVPSVSAGYELCDFEADVVSDGEQTLLENMLGETERELGLDREQITRYAILGLLHILSSNELSFVLLMETSLTCDGLIEQLRRRIAEYEQNRESHVELKKASEHFEYWRILPVEADQVRDYSLEWEAYCEKKWSRVERCVYPLYFYLLATANPTMVPWKYASQADGVTA